MKKLLITVFVFASLSLAAQVPSERPDSLLKPAKTDSADFSNSTYQRDTSRRQQEEHPMKKDTLPMDDKKPKHPPKK